MCWVRGGGYRAKGEVSGLRKLSPGKKTDSLHLLGDTMREACRRNRSASDCGVIKHENLDKEVETPELGFEE